MKIVIDTNVYLSNFIFGGITSKVCTYCFENHEIFISPFIKNELARTLANKFKYPALKIDFVLKTVSLVSRETSPTNAVHGVCRDADDNSILQLCEYVGADYLITGDKDLLVLEHFGQTQILSPRQFFEVFN